MFAVKSVLCAAEHSATLTSLSLTEKEIAGTLTHYKIYQRSSSYLQV